MHRGLGAGVVALVIFSGYAANAEEGAPVSEAAASVPVSDAAAPSAKDGHKIDVNVFVSTTVHHNFNIKGPKTPSKLSGTRVFDKQPDSLTVDVAEVVLQVPVADPGDSGFRFDVAYGTTVPKVVTGGHDIDLQQAYLSYIARVGSGLRIDAGTFITHIGAEVIEGYDGYNDNVSRSILFGYAIPFSHTGLRLGYTLSETVSAMFMVTNGWTPNVVDNNSGKSLCAQLMLKPVDTVQFYLNYIGGPETPDNNTDLRHLVDVVAVVKPTSALTLTLNGDFGMQQNADADAASWRGIALIARFDASDTHYLALRAEYFDDSDNFSGLAGAGAAAGDKYMEVTITPAFKLGENVQLRGEVRFDKASKLKIFPSSKGPKDSMVAAGLNLLLAY